MASGGNGPGRDRAGVRDRASWRQWRGVGQASCRASSRYTIATLRPRIRPTPEAGRRPAGTGRQAPGPDPRGSQAPSRQQGQHPRFRGNQAGRARLRRQRRLAPSTSAASAASSTETGSRPPGRRRLAALLRRCATGTRASSTIAPGDQHHRHRKPGCPGRRPGPTTKPRLKRLHTLRITPP
jgi:hypothetical protein